MNRFSFSYLIVLISLPLSFSLLGQTKLIKLTESSFVVRNRSSERFYFGLSAGDQLTFKITTSSLTRFSFEEYKGASLVQISNPDSVINHTLTIEHEGIYFFTFEQSGFLAGRSFCSLNVTRTPASKETEKFNSTVYWKSQTDTIKYKESEKYIERVDTIITSVVNQYIELKGNPKANSSNISFFLPENYSSWSYFIATGKDAEKVYGEAEKQFEATSSIVKKYGLMAGIAINGIASFATNPMCKEVKYRFSSDNNINKSETIDTINSLSDFKSTCLDFKKVNDSIKRPTHLFVQNCSRKKLKVLIRITSVELIERWATREIDKIRIETKDVPYLKN